MAKRNSDDSVTLGPAEVSTLLHLIAKWEIAQPGTDTVTAVVDVACEVREMLAVAR